VHLQGKRYGSTHETTDEGLMTKLGEILGGNMREDFIVVHMQVGGWWVAGVC
jgi:E1A/CREB-binding protein